MNYYILLKDDSWMKIENAEMDIVIDIINFYEIDYGTVITIPCNSIEKIFRDGEEV